MAEDKKDSLLALLNSRRILSKGFGKKYRDEFKRALDDYEIKSIDKRNLPNLYNRLHVPYIFSTVESGLPAMFERMPTLHMQQGGKKDKDFSDFAQLVWDYEARIANIEDLIEEAGFTFFLAGQSSVVTEWETDTMTVKREEEVPLIGEDGMQVISDEGVPMSETVTKEFEVVTRNQPVVRYLPYDKVHFSPESKFVIDDEDNRSIPYIIYQLSMETDAVKYIFGVDDVEDTSEELDKEKINTEIDWDSKTATAGIDKEDLKRTKVYFYCGQLPKDEIGEDWRPYQTYSAAFTIKQVLQKPKEKTKKPILNLGNYGSPEKFFRFGEARVLRELEQDVSIGRSVVADYRDKLATKVAVPHTTEFDEESFKSPKQFTVVKFIGDKYPQYITPPPVPETVLAAINMSRDDISMASAQLDVSRGGMSSSVDTATGQKIYAKAHERRIQRKKGKIGKFIKAIAKNLLTAAAENWTVDDFVKITDIPREEIEAKGFLEKLAQVGKEFDLIIDLDDVIDNKEARSAEAIAMYREMSQSPHVNQEELIKFVMTVGFDQKDIDRFLSGQMTPEQLAKALEQMFQMKLVDQNMAAQIAMGLQQMMAQSQGNVGRPESQNPTDIVQNAMPGTDATQMTAQRQNVDKLMKPKGPQSVV